MNAASLKKDLPASLVVFLVALPLSIGIASASGAPVRAGLVAAICGGVIVGLFGGAPMQVSGPAAGLTVMVFGFVQRFGFATTCVIGMVAGGLQMLAGAGGIAQGALAISPAVLQAMLAGIGVLIALGQVHVFLGASPRGGALANLEALPEAVRALNGSALLIGVVTLVTLLAWNRFVAKRVPFLPGSLVAITTGTVVSLFVPGQVPHVTVDGGLFTSLAAPTIGSATVTDIALAALALFVVASAESLLCAVATDQLHAGPRANLNRELFAQGLANLTSGGLGGLPITGVIVRSSANIAAGAASKASAILHGVWMLLFVVLFSGFLAKVPLAALAALLVHVGVNLVKVKEIRKLVAFNEVLVYGVTLLGVVFINLLWGIGLGFGLALVMMLRRTTVVGVDVKDEAGTIKATVTGSLHFLAVPQLVSRLRAIPAGREVHLRFERLGALDHAAIEAIRAWRVGYQNAGGTVVKEPLDALWRELIPRAA
ncbi:MAG: SulP family inorganic anion transporter [Myxococcus sp.]|nr:SulP family inorganic anion transporter [Myxococcus sp.]